eukprot:TRINITY_DN32632_c0_g1_i1.p1 TRINITY_DN32632_c0_g1~~TRINITY_DN32632_c0_g1_i1.p1  ORF type:complete len:208 (-),score=55.76 TRINITY_DN32632_c0_g1_i1:59-622(-)
MCIRDSSRPALYSSNPHPDPAMPIDMSELDPNDPQALEKKIKGLRDCDSFFVFSQFLEFFVYHFLFFFALGPLLTLIMITTSRGRRLAKNLGFTGFSVIVLVQYLNWLATTGSTYMLFSRVGKLYLADVYMLYASTFVWVLNSASKYATIHPEKLQLIRNKYLTTREQLEDELSVRWQLQDLSLIHI